MSGCPAVPALSKRALPAQRSVCGGLSEVPVFSFLDLHMNMHHHNMPVMLHSFLSLPLS